MYGMLYVCAKNGKNISNPLSFCNIYYIYRTYTYLLSFQVRQRHVQFNCLLTRDKIEFHESPFEENSERLYITSCEYVPTYNIVWFVYFVRMITQNFVCIMKKRRKRGIAHFHFPTCGFVQNWISLAMKSEVWHQKLPKIWERKVHFRYDCRKLQTFHSWDVRWG